MKRLSENRALYIAHNPALPDQKGVGQRNTDGRWSKSWKTLVLQRWTSQYVSGLSWIEQYTEPCFLAIFDSIIFIKNENSLRKISADCFLYNPFLLNNLYENKFIYHKKSFSCAAVMPVPHGTPLRAPDKCLIHSAEFRNG